MTVKVTRNQTALWCLRLLVMDMCGIIGIQTNNLLESWTGASLSSLPQLIIYLDNHETLSMISSHTHDPRIM